MRSFTKVLFAFVALILMRAAPYNASDMKVASHSVGEVNTPGYEEFGFWVKNGHRGEIDYYYGKNPKEIKISYSGKAIFDGQNCFKVAFTNGLVLFVVPDGMKLKVFDARGKYTKVFGWKYEGPVDGAGTYRDACAQDDNEAMEIIKKHYLK